MPSYVNQAGNSLGSLLRFIQEQKSQSPIIPAKSEVGSPVRDTVQEPLSGSEGFGSSKVVSIRPEGTLTPGGLSQNATPQSSRVGPISIGGADVAPVGVVAGNEPGSGFTIPSATRTTGDVLNKTGAASGQGPGIGTTIKASIPESVKGQATQQLNRTYDTSGLDKTAADRQAAIAAGDKTLQAYQDRIAAEEAAQKAADAEFARKDAELSGKTFDPGNPQQLAMARDIGQSLSKKVNQGQVLGDTAPTLPKGLTSKTPPAAPVTIGPQKPVNIPQAVSSGGLKVQSPAKSSAPSIGTNLASLLRKLFGF